uniref:EF-hand domain-containing protein n=1 Tax=Glossina pallidipes TaxID=7398 RepID=A0A1B0ABJ9_GLOPL
MSEQEYDKEQLRILRNAFKAFDHEDKGFIEHADVHQILEILGQKLDDKQVKGLIKEVDKSNSGKLDFAKFCKLAARFVEVEEDGPVLMGELKEAFRVYDREGKGYLTVQVLRTILKELDDKLSNQDLDMIIDEIDADGSGTVDFDEFVQVMTGKSDFLYRDTLHHLCYKDILDCAGVCQT